MERSGSVFPVLQSLQIAPVIGFIIRQNRNMCLQPKTRITYLWNLKPKSYFNVADIRVRHPQRQVDIDRYYKPKSI